MKQLATNVGKAPAWMRPTLDRISALQAAIDSGEPERGGILAALRRSPLVGAELDLSREAEDDRQLEL